jgi:hypothetical protein
LCSIRVWTKRRSSLNYSSSTRPKRGATLTRERKNQESTSPRRALLVCCCGAWGIGAYRASRGDSGAAPHVALPTRPHASEPAGEGGGTDVLRQSHSPSVSPNVSGTRNLSPIRAPKGRTRRGAARSFALASGGDTRHATACARDTTNRRPIPQGETLCLLGNPNAP